MALCDPTHLYDGDLSPRADRVSRMISVASYAPFLSAVMFPFLNITAGDPWKALVCTVITFLTATLVPAVMVGHFSRKTGNTDGDVYRREDRMAPLAWAVVLYAIGAALLVLADAPRISTASMVSYAVCTFIVLLISTRWKMSIHATGAAGPAVALGMTYFPWGLLVLLILPPVMWSRYVRRKHTSAQLIGGAAFGLAATWVVLTLLTRSVRFRRDGSRRPGFRCHSRRVEEKAPTSRCRARSSHDQGESRDTSGGHRRSHRHVPIQGQEDHRRSP